MPDQIDPRLPALAGEVGGGNLLGQFGQFANALGALQRNRLLSQEANSRQRMGELAQMHTGADGSFDSTGYVKSLLHDPATAFMAPQVMNQFAEKGLIDANTTARNIENWKAQADVISSTAFSTAQGIPNDSNPADTKSFIGKVADLASVRNPDGTTAFPVDKLTGYLTSALQGVKTNADLRQHVLQMAQMSLRGREQMENIGTQLGLGPNGEPKLYFYNKLAEGQGAGGNAPAAAAYMAGVGQGQGAPPAAPASTASPAAPASAPPGSLTLGPGTARADQLAYMGKQYWPQLVDASNQAVSLKNFLGEARALLKDYSPGRGAELRSEAARLLEALPGADPSSPLIRAVAGGDVSNAQAFQKLTVAMATQWMRQANEGNSAVRSSTEWAKFQNAFPGLENDPRAIQKMYNYMDFLADMSKKKLEKFHEFQATPGYDIVRFPSMWNDFAASQADQFANSRLAK